MFRTLFTSCRRAGGGLAATSLGGCDCVSTVVDDLKCANAHATGKHL